MANLPHIGCVSFLNSKPLIDPLLDDRSAHVHFAVPSALLQLVTDNVVPAALLSIVDYHRSPDELLLLPAGMIGCDGPTLTVRLFSKIPPAAIRTLHGDTDSHTSVLLAQLLLRERYGAAPTLVPFSAADQTSEPEAMLLIGDKVVNAAPDPHRYPHQLDLGEAWKNLTGLPFVFAMWMIRADAVAREPTLPRLLADARRRGSEMTDTLVARHAAEKRWPPDLARRYFTEYLRYEVTDRARQGLALFFDTAVKMNILSARRPIRYLEISQ